MRHVASLPPKAPTLICRDCLLSAPAPIVVKVPNPVNDTHGRCSNRKACELRQLRRANKAKAVKS